MNFEDLTLNELHTFIEDIPNLHPDLVEGMLRWANGEEVKVEIIERTSAKLKIKLTYPR